MADAMAKAPRLRNVRKRDARARTIDVRRISARELEAGRTLYPNVEGASRPATRGACAGGERPCPFVSCRHHLYLDVSPHNGSIKLNFPDLEVEEMTETCTLDVADRGGVTLELIGEIMNLTRIRVDQIETLGLEKMGTFMSDYAQGR